MPWLVEPIERKCQDPWFKHHPRPAQISSKPQDIANPNPINPLGKRTYSYRRNFQNCPANPRSTNPNGIPSTLRAWEFPSTNVCDCEDCA